MADPYKNNVVLYLPLEGSRDGDTVILDKTGKTTTAYGTVALKTTVTPPFGTTALWVNGNGTSPTNGNFLTVPDSNDFDLEAKDFTIEAWVYPTSVPGGGGIVGKQRAAASYGEWSFTLGGTRYLIFGATTGGENTSWTLITLTSNVQVSLNVWTHVAVTRKGTIFSLWNNGVLSATSTASGAITNGTSSLSIGANKDDGQYNIIGYIKEVRITKGVARYTRNFYVDQKPFDWDTPEQPRIMI